MWHHTEDCVTLAISLAAVKKPLRDWRQPVEHFTARLAWHVFGPLSQPEEE